jgi:hypothetical protein
MMEDLMLHGLIGKNVVHGLQTYTIPGTYNFTVPNGVKQLSAIGVAGGGGGSGYAGGGGGGSLITTIDVTPGQIIPIIVGTGGNGTQTSSANDGGNTTVSSYTCYGGKAPTGNPGGSGGVGYGYGGNGNKGDKADGINASYGGVGGTGENGYGKGGNGGQNGGYVGGNGQNGRVIIIW